MRLTWPTIKWTQLSRSSDPPSTLMYDACACSIISILKDFPSVIFYWIQTSCSLKDAEMLTMSTWSLCLVPIRKQLYTNLEKSLAEFGIITYDLWFQTNQRSITQGRSQQISVIWQSSSNLLIGMHIENRGTVSPSFGCHCIKI